MNRKSNKDNINIDDIKLKDFNIPVFGRTIVTNLLPPARGYITYENFINSYESSNSKFNKDDLEVIEIIKDSLKSNNRLPFDLLPQEIEFIENNDISRWCEYLVFRYKLKVYPKQKKVAEFPVYLLIEPVSACNLRCIMCFQADVTFTKNPYMGIMDFDFFKKIIDEAVAGGTKAITLASRGEPTMNRHLPKMLEYIKGKFLEVKINTNGTRLTEKLCHSILSCGVTELVWSIDAPRKELYEKIRVGGIFEKVINNILMFNNIKNTSYPNSTLITTASGVMFHEEQDIQEYKNFFGKLADNVAAQQIENRWNTYTNETQPDITDPCQYLWERMYVWFDGKCNPCDVDYKSYLEVGNVNEKTIKEIWHGKTYEKLRKDHLEKNRKKCNPCDRCGLC